jgi:hypothetical protein
MNTSRVSANFVFVDGQGQTNMPQIQMAGRDRDTSYLEVGSMETVVEFWSESAVPPNVSPGGEYVLQSVFIETFAGRGMHLAGLPNISCQAIREEPREGPRFKDLEWEL